MLNLPIKLDDLLKAIDTLPSEHKRLIREHLNQAAETGSPEEMMSPERIPGLNAGMIWISDDFDDPLPDSFWLGEA
jgi:hypothetical protein